MKELHEQMRQWLIENPDELGDVTECSYKEIHPRGMLGVSNKGKYQPPPTPEQLEKMRGPRGPNKPMDPEKRKQWIENMKGSRSGCNMGEKNGHWKGGISTKDPKAYGAMKKREYRKRDREIREAKKLRL